MILYFSGTGNSRFVAKSLGIELEDTVVSMNDYLKEKKVGNFDSQKPYIFVVPSYMSRMPMKIEEFINNSHFTGNKDAYFVFTAGQAIGNAGKHCKKLCVKNSLNYKGTTGVQMPANYVVMYDVLPKEQADENAEKVIETIKKLALDIKNGDMKENKQLLGNKSFSMIAPIFTKTMVSAKAFHVNKDCIECGTCEKLCPLNNIKLIDSKPVWSKDCMHCMACISACPTKAINYGKSTVNRNRYYLNK